MAQTDPDYLAELEKESEFLNQKGRRGNDRIALKDVGESMLLRIVPYQFDDRGKWFARVARHWIAQRPYICTRDTDIAHGGDPDGKCEMCDVIDKLNRDRNKTVSQLAYKMTAVPQYLVMAVPIEHVSSNGQATQFRGNDLKKAKELWLYKEAFQDVMTIFKTFLRRTESKLSIVDPVQGCDLWMSKSRRGLRFDRADPLPLAPKSADPEEFIQAVLKSITWKADEPVVGDDLDDLLLKIEDICFDRRSSTRDDDRRGGGGGRGEDDRRGGGGRGEDDRRPASRDDDRRPASRDDDRRPASRDDDRRPAARDDDRRTDDRTRSDSPRTESRRDDDRRPAARDDDRRPATRDDDRRPAARDDDRRPASRDDDRRPATRDDDRGGSRSDDRGGREERRSSSRPDDDLRTRGRADDDRHPDLEAGEPRGGGRSRDLDEDDQRPQGLREDEPAAGGREEEEPPPVSARVAGSRQITAPPAAVTGTARPGAAREEREEEDDGLPEDDKDKAPATPPKDGEVVKPAEVAQPASSAPARQASSLTSSIRDRVKKHDASAK